MGSKKVLLAADILVAFVDRSHPKHLHTTAFFRYFSQQKYYLYTTPFVVSDCHTLIAKRISSTLAKEFIKAVSLSTITMLFPDSSDMKLAYQTLLSSHSPDLSFQETLFASIAQRRKITTICTFSYLHPLFPLSAFYLPI